MNFFLKKILTMGKGEAIRSITERTGGSEELVSGSEGSYRR